MAEHPVCPENLRELPQRAIRFSRIPFVCDIIFERGSSSVAEHYICNVGVMGPNPICSTSGGEDNGIAKL